jgi:uncharacterized protein YycO
MNLLMVGWSASVPAGCGGDARVDLAAADALDLAAGEIRAALAEYNAEVDRADRARQAAAVRAFVERITGDVDNPDAVDMHTAAFTEALAALWADQHAEWQRYGHALGNVEAVEEIAAGLRRMGIATLTVKDDVRRYLGSLIEAGRQTRSASPGDES